MPPVGLAGLKASDFLPQAYGPCSPYSLDPRVKATAVTDASAETEGVRLGEKAQKVTPLESGKRV